MANSTTNLDVITVGQGSKEVGVNALFDAASQSMIFGRRAATTSGLTWGYLGGRFTKGDGTNIAVANATIALSASLTNYIEVDTDGTVTKNTSAFTAGRIPLYTVVTGASTVTSYTDHRNGAQGSFGASLAFPVPVASGGTGVTTSTGTGSTVLSASPTFTGVPAAPTAAAATNTTQIATTAFVTGAVADLVGTAPALLNTLGELSDALADNENYATTITSALALKAPIASPTFTGTVTIPTGAVITTPTLTVLDSAFTIQDNSDPTKQALVQLSGITTGTTRTYTEPNASGTRALIDFAQTWTAAQTFNDSAYVFGLLGVGTFGGVECTVAIHGDNSGIKFTNATTGETSADGLVVGYGNGGGTTAYIFQRENDALVFGTNNAVRVTIEAGGDVVTASNLKLGTAGNGIYIKGGSNATVGVATLVAGTVTVNTTKVTASSRIFHAGQNSSGTAGEVTVSARAAGTSFTLTSLNVLDTRDIAWWILEET